MSETITVARQADSATNREQPTLLFNLPVGIASVDDLTLVAAFYSFKMSATMNKNSGGPGSSGLNMVQLVANLYFWVNRHREMLPLTLVVTSA